MMRRKVIAPYREKGKPKDWIETSKGNYRDTCPQISDDISIPFWSMLENTAHPTQKPEKLIAKLILASSAWRIGIRPLPGFRHHQCCGKSWGGNILGSS